MKRTYLGLFFVVCASYSVVYSAESEQVPVLTRQERDTLKLFYLQADYTNEAYFENLNDLQINFLCDLISSHIKILEHKILQKKSCLRTQGMLKALGWIAGVLGGGWVTNMFYQNLSKCSFSSVEMPDHVMNNISSINFSRSEKRQLEKMLHTMDANGDKLIRRYSPHWYYRLNDLSDENYNKLDYLALRLAISKTKQDMFMIGGFAIACAAGAVYQLYKLSRYAERLNERLERDKRIFDLLQKQKEMRLEKFYAK